MKFIQEITLDLNANTAYTTIAAKQSDNGSRKIVVHLTKNNIPYEADSNNKAYFRCRKPDGYAVIDPATINEDGTITIELSAQALAVAGRAYADVVEYDTESNITLSSASFILIIMAAPDVANQAISSDEFGYLQQVTNDANAIINEAEAWAIGRRGGTEVSDTDSQYENNAKYYSEQAESAFEKFTELNISATASANASVEVEEDSGGIITGLIFGLPAGPTGAAGPNGVYIGNIRPSENSDIRVWIDTSATSTALMIDSDQVEYSATATYSSNTIGYAVQNIIGSVDNAVEVANVAEIKADEAKTAVASISILETAMAAINSELSTKITSPGLNASQGILCAAKNSDEEIEYSWESEISYSTVISDRPSINGQEILGNQPLSYYGIAPAAPSESPYLQVGPSGIQLETLSSGIQTSLSAADTAIQVIRFNNVDYSVSATDTMKLVDLGNVLTESNVVNKNYLDNPWFTINQHGNRTINTGSVTEGVYLCDRWKVINDSASGSRTIIIANQSINISTVSTNDKNITVGQLIDDEIWQALSGQKVCASVNYSFGGTSYVTTSWTFTCPIYDSSVGTVVQKRFDEQYKWGGRISVQEINEKKYLAFEIVYYQDYEASDDINIILRKTKLEMGEFSTLDNEAMPIYSEELKKCQRYYRYYGGENPDKSVPLILGQGISAAATRLDWIMPINMVSTPQLYSSVDLIARRGFEATNNQGTISSAGLNTTVTTGIENINIVSTTASLSSLTAYYVILPKSVAAADSSQSDTISYFTLSAEP